MKVYLAARFSRLEELLGYKAELETHGIAVTSRWLLGGHEWVGVPDEEIPAEQNGVFARIDLDDIDAADMIVCFTEEPGSPYSRGGRHVEFGYALAKGKPPLLVGHLENIFCCLPEVGLVETWPDALASLLRIQAGVEQDAA